MKPSSIATLAFSLLVLTVSICPADQPGRAGLSTIYRGTVLDAEGRPVSGSHDMVLRYYGAAGTQPLFVEALADVQVNDGCFELALGSGAVFEDLQFDALEGVFAANPDVELEVVIDGRLQEPRLRILPGGHSEASRLVLAGVVVDDDEPHSKGFRSKSTASAVQAASLRPGGRVSSGVIVNTPTMQSNPFLVDVVSLGESEPLRQQTSVTVLPPAKRGDDAAEVNPPRHEDLYDENGHRYGTRTTKIDDSLVASGRGPGTTPGLSVEFEGVGNLSGVLPPDTEGAVGPNHYVQVVNSFFAVFDKSGANLSGPFETRTLFAGVGGACQNDNSGDAIFLYDEHADRWVLTQFAVSSGQAVCFAVSTTPDPTGAYHRYQVNTTRFPDYYKLGVWPDPDNNAFFMGTNTGSSGQYDIYAVDRESMLAGVAARPAQLFQNHPNLLMPADLDGDRPPPAGSPGIFFTFRDGGEPYFGSPAADSIDIWEFDVDWSTPGNSTFALVQELTPPEINDFNWTVCGFFVQNCLPQPGTSTKLDSASWWPMQRLQYRNYGPHEGLVGSWTVNALAVGTKAAPRWFELRRTTGAWEVHQEGTHSPEDDAHRWMPSISADGSGNLAIGYSVVDADASLFPSIRYATRNEGDPLGTLQPEATLITGGGAQTSSSSRWGDYASMDVDPSDDCTFWFTSEYLSSTSSAGWKTHVGAFSVPGCTGFVGLRVTPAVQEVCGSVGTAVYGVELTAPFVGTTDLAVNGCPANATCDFTVNPVVNPATASSLEVSGLVGVAPGDYALTVRATDPNTTESLDLIAGLTVFAGTPATPALVNPSDGSVNVVWDPVFEWAVASGASAYRLEVATDAGFATVVLDESDINGTSFQGSGLTPSTQYFWRVTAANTCGAEQSLVFDFTTESVLGDCVGATETQLHLDDDFESGQGLWVHNGTGDTWSLSNARAHSGGSSYHAVDPASVSDQYLVSPTIDVPSGVVSTVLQFWSYQSMESDPPGCWDGSMLQVSTDGGGSWSQLTPDSATDPYDGPITDGTPNPAFGLQAWCGDPQDWTLAAVDLGAFAGQTVQLGFRMTSDAYVGREGWYVDDVVVKSCVSTLAPEIFADGFEGGDTSAWTDTIP